MLLVEFFEDPLVQRLILFSIRVDLGDDRVKIRVRPQRSLAYEFLAASRTLFVARSQRRYDTIVAKSVETFFGGHRTFEYIQANGTHELVLEDFGRDGDLCLVVDDLVRYPIEFVHVELPGLREIVRVGATCAAAGSTLRFAAHACFSFLLLLFCSVFGLPINLIYLRFGLDSVSNVNMVDIFAFFLLLFFSLSLSLVYF